MDLNSSKDFMSDLSTRDLPTGVAALVGMALLFFVSKSLSEK